MSGDAIVEAGLVFPSGAANRDRCGHRVHGACVARRSLPRPQRVDGTDRAHRRELIGSVLLKRVVAVEGDVVEVKDGRVTIDGSEIHEPRISLEAGGGPDFGPLRIPQGKVLLLGDNRGNSRDGRFFGLVDREQVLGRALRVIARDGEPSMLPL